jgi:hypothetical protein
VADALSRLGMLPKDEEAAVQPTEETMAETFALEDDEIEFPKNKYPLSYAYVSQAQRKDEALQTLYSNKPEVYRKEHFKHGSTTYNLITRNGKIVIPSVLQRRAVEWYHTILMHPGETRMELTMAQHYYWKGMRNTINDVCKTCKTCQSTKSRYKKYGLLPEKEAEITPWKQVCIDLIGPYTIGKGDKTITLYCLL